MRRLALIFVVVVVALAGASVAIDAQRPAPDPRPALRPVSGRVLAADSGTPLRRVRIMLSATAVTADPVFTDDEGRFQIAVPGSGPYTLTCTKPGFARHEVAAGEPSRDPLLIRMARGAAIVGRVIDEYGDPLVARVRVTGFGAELTADADVLGEFRIGSLPSGRYVVDVARVLALDAGAEQPPVVVDLKAGEEASVVLTTTTQDGRMRAALDARSRAPRGDVQGTGQISGHVTAATGLPVGGAIVNVGLAGESRQSTVTDAGGRYAFDGLPPGAFTLGVFKFAPSFVGNNGTRVILREGQVRDDVHVVLQRPPLISGIVRDEYGEPVEGVTVEAWQRLVGGGRSLLMPAQGMAPPARTDDRGRYRLFAPPGTVYVVALDGRVGDDHVDRVDDAVRVYYPGTPAAYEAMPLELEIGRDAAGIDITFAVRARGSVSGFAFDAAGDPLTAPIVLMDSSRSGAPLPAPRRAPVGPDGAFVFANVAAGDYVLQALVRGPGGRATEMAVRYATVTDGESPPIVLRTTPGTTLSGRMVFETSGDPPADARTFGLGVQSSDMDYLLLDREAARAEVEPDGAFALPGLYGPLRVTARPLAGWWLKSVSIGAVDAAEQPFVFGAVPRIENVTATFTDTAAEVTGRVRDGSEPVARYSVLVFPHDRTRWWASSGYVRLAQPDAEGVFRAVSLPPGDYFAAAVDRFDMTAEWLDADILAELAPRAGRFSLRERERRTLDLDLIRRPPTRP